ncbi:MAG: L,D-transpeptidase [Candidatus Aminicenantales bacterium]
MKRKKRGWKFLLGFLAFLFLLEAIAYMIAWRSTRWGWDPSALGALAQDASRLAAENAILEKRIKALSPTGLYIVIDSGRNVLYLRKGQKVLRQAVVSCGSGSILEEPGGRRRWVFDTPRGEFHVKTKIRNPYWIKPDWAFIEEGEEIPKNPQERIEPGVLGDYALGFGDGYFLHGTLYTRLLGRNVTHGCIRVGDEDLKILFERASIGTKIYIY